MSRGKFILIHVFRNILLLFCILTSFNLYAQHKDIRTYPFCSYGYFPHDFRNFVYREMQYPEEALAKGLEGKVVLRVSFDKIKAPMKCEEVVYSTDPSFTKEIMRLIQKTGNWVPAEVVLKRKNKTVKTAFGRVPVVKVITAKTKYSDTISINFVLPPLPDTVIYQAAAEQGDMVAQYHMAKGYADFLWNLFPAKNSHGYHRLELLWDLYPAKDAHEYYDEKAKESHSDQITKNDSLALLWLKKAAEQNYVEAQIALHLAYDKLDNYSESVYWLDKAAKQDSIFAKRLGDYYGEGKKGVETNLFKAKILYKQFVEKMLQSDTVKMSRLERGLTAQYRGKINKIEQFEKEREKKREKNHNSLVLISREKDGKWGFVDMEWKEVIPSKYDEVSAFHGDIARVNNQGKWVYMDIEGNEIIPAKYDSLKPEFDVRKAQKNW